MAIFRKRQPAASKDLAAHPTVTFWAWWAADGHKARPHESLALTDQLTTKLRAIHPDLTWHFGPGTTARHRLTVSAGGIAAARPAAERWLRAAPSTNELWEFRSSRERDPNALTVDLSLEGHSFRLAQTEFMIESVADLGRVHVAVFHPRFREVAESVRRQVIYLVLMWLLGEDDVERWVGHRAWLTEEPPRACSASDVVSAVHDIARQQDPEAWTLTKWEDSEGNLTVSNFRRGLRWIDYPTLDLHHEISLTYPCGGDGFPDDPEVFAALYEVEDDLELQLGARAILVGLMSHRGVRTFHVYSDGDDQNTGDKIHSWAAGRHLSIETQRDPAWSAVRRFTG